MENDQEASSSSNQASIGIGFPLALALLLMMLFCMSGFFTCCLHWNKIRSIINGDDDTDNIQTNIIPLKSSPLHTMPEQNQDQSLLASMPGDKIPKFLAMASPCKPPALDKLTVTVHKPTHS